FPFALYRQVNDCEVPVRMVYGPAAGPLTSATTPTFSGQAATCTPDTSGPAGFSTRSTTWKSADGVKSGRTGLGVTVSVPTSGDWAAADAWLELPDWLAGAWVS